MSERPVTVQSLLDTMNEVRRRQQGGGRTLFEANLDNMTLARLREEFPQLNIVTSRHVPDGQVYVVDQDKVDEMLRRPIRFDLNAD